MLTQLWLPELTEFHVAPESVLRKMNPATGTATTRVPLAEDATSFQVVEGMLPGLHVVPELVVQYTMAEAMPFAAHSFVPSSEVLKPFQRVPISLIALVFVHVAPELTLVQIPL